MPIKALEDYVRGGGGLAWYLGPQVRAAFYNDKLYPGHQEAGAVPRATGQTSPTCSSTRRTPAPT